MQIRLLLLARQEEVELVLGGLAGGGRAQQEGLPVQVDRGGAGGLLGETAGLEPEEIAYGFCESARHYFRGR